MPTRTDTPLRLIVPFGRDGATDRLARIVARALAVRLGRDVRVENHPGAGGRTGTAIAARALPDGNTLLFGTSTTQCIAANLYRALPYDPIGDFEALALVGWAPNVLAVSPKLPYVSVADVIAAARSAPGRLSYASAGHGQTIHLCGALFGASARIDLRHVEFSMGSMLAYPDLLAGEVTMMFDNVLAVAPYVADGQLRALAVTSRVRTPALPGVPTMAEAGVAGYEIDLWLGLLAPGGTPDPARRSLEASILDALDQPSVREDLVAAGLTVAATGAAGFQREIDAGTVTWKDVLYRCGVTAE